MFSYYIKHILLKDILGKINATWMQIWIKFANIKLIKFNMYNLMPICASEKTYMKLSGYLSV